MPCFKTFREIHPRFITLMQQMHLSNFIGLSSTKMKILLIFGEIKHISAYVQPRLTTLVLNESIGTALLFTLCKLTHLHIHEFSSIFIFAEKSENKQI